MKCVLPWTWGPRGTMPFHAEGAGVAGGDLAPASLPKMLPSGQQLPKKARDISHCPLAEANILYSVPSKEKREKWVSFCSESQESRNMMVA